MWENDSEKEIFQIDCNVKALDHVLFKQTIKQVTRESGKFEKNINDISDLLLLF